MGAPEVRAFVVPAELAGVRLDVALARLDQPLDPGARQVRREALEPHVQPETGERRGDDEGPDLGRAHGLTARGRGGYQILDFTCPFDLRITSMIARS